MTVTLFTDLIIVITVAAGVSLLAWLLCKHAVHAIDKAFKRTIQGGNGQ